MVRPTTCRLISPQPWAIASVCYVSVTGTTRQTPRTSARRGYQEPTTDIGRSGSSHESLTRKQTNSEVRTPRIEWSILSLICPPYHSLCRKASHLRSFTKISQHSHTQFYTRMSKQNGSIFNTCRQYISMRKPRVRDEQRVSSPTQTYESNARLLGFLLWTLVLAQISVFILLRDQLRILSPRQIVSLLFSIGSVVAVMLISWPLLYRLLSRWRHTDHSLTDMF